MSTRKRYALIGTGGRCVVFLDAIAGLYREHAELVALCDLSPTRMAFHQERLKRRFEHPDVPHFRADDFDGMIEQTRPDIIIVCTMDATHHTYVIRAMELGCDVICEKPMTTDAEKIRAIRDAVTRTGRTLRVTFNNRYEPFITRIKELILAGTIGTPTAVDLTWLLDTRHGADYFRRWHATKANSGGLLVHKATHHFDLVNWLLDAVPTTVYAMGDLRFYGRRNAEARGETYAYERYTGHPEARNDPFALFLDEDDDLNRLYHNAEGDSGYIRDKNVFGDHIDIEDTMAVMVRYDSRAILNYSLVAYCPWEGLRGSITGNKGRIEFYERRGSHIITAKDDEQLAREQNHEHRNELTVFPMFGNPYTIEVPKASGGHRGGDPLLVHDLFSPNRSDDPCNRAASHIDGMYSVLIGAAANQSMATGAPVAIQDLLAPQLQAAMGTREQAR